MIIAGTKYPEAQRILVAHLDNLLQTEALQNLKNVRCVRLNVYTQTHTHTHTHTTSGRRLPNLQEKEGPSLVRLTLLTLYSTTLNNTNTTTRWKKAVDMIREWLLRVVFDDHARYTTEFTGGRTTTLPYFLYVLSLSPSLSLSLTHHSNTGTRSVCFR